MGENDLHIVSEEEYLLSILNIKPADRLKICFELSEWSMKFNKSFKQDFESRKKSLFELL